MIAFSLHRRLVLLRSSYSSEEEELVGRQEKKNFVGRFPASRIIAIIKV